MGCSLVHASNSSGYCKFQSDISSSLLPCHLDSRSPQGSRVLRNWSCLFWEKEKKNDHSIIWIFKSFGIEAKKKLSWLSSQSCLKKLFSRDVDFFKEGLSSYTNFRFFFSEGRLTFNIPSFSFSNRLSISSPSFATYRQAKSRKTKEIMIYAPGITSSGTQ